MGAASLTRPPPTLLQIFERHLVCLEDLFEASNYFDAPIHLNAVYFYSRDKPLNLRNLEYTLTNSEG